jgi:hypothetical protein
VLQSKQEQLRYLLPQFRKFNYLKRVSQQIRNFDSASDKKIDLMPLLKEKINLKVWHQAIKPLKVKKKNQSRPT